MPDPDIPVEPKLCDLVRLAEAFVFASPHPVTARALQAVLPEPWSAVSVLEALRDACVGRGVILVESGEEWHLRTAPDLAERLRPVVATTAPLPRAAMETLVAIALYQPVTRAGIERARGVALAQASLDLLLEAGLIQPCGRLPTPGAAGLWTTTPRFLVQFGLRDLRDLPGAAVAVSLPSADPPDEPPPDR